VKRKQRLTRRLDHRKERKSERVPGSGGKGPVLFSIRSGKSEKEIKTNQLKRRDWGKASLCGGGEVGRGDPVGRKIKN